MGNMFEFSAAADGGSPTIEMCRLLHFYFLFFFQNETQQMKARRRQKIFVRRIPNL